MVGVVGLVIGELIDDVPLDLGFGVIVPETVVVTSSVSVAIAVFANVLDWRTAFAFEASLADYASLDVPVLLVRGALANEAMVTLTDVLAANLSDARYHAVDGASHFLITTHAPQCAALRSEFLAEVAD